MKYRAQRYPTRFPVTLKVGAVGRPCEVTSISASGARVTVDHLFGVGEKVKLTYSGNQVPGTVRWATADAAGIVFDRALNKGDLDRIRFGLRAAGQRPSHRVGFAAWQ